MKINQGDCGHLPCIYIEPRLNITVKTIIFQKD